MRKIFDLGLVIVFITNVVKCIFIISSLRDVFYLPDSPFRHEYNDLISPLPPYNKFSYIFTCIDHYTRWSVMTLIRDISAETIAKSFIES